jgi:hypothetical protein
LCHTLLEAPSHTHIESIAIFIVTTFRALTGVII